MTKSERLMFLVNMIKNRGTALVSEMARECEVSQRTIYRDVNSLLRLNFPLYYDNGYRLARDVSFPFPGFGSEDIELICYSLRNNPLSKHPFFGQRFQVIEQGIKARFHGRGGSRTDNLFLFEEERHFVEKTRESDIIATFLKAIRERRKVTLRLFDSDSGNGVCIPMAIKLKNSEPYLMAIAAGEGLVREWPISSVDSIRLTDERFMQRPLHLLGRDLVPQKNVDEV